MIKLFSMEFWMGVQFFIDLVFVVLLFMLVKRLNRDRDTHERSNMEIDDNSSLREDESHQVRDKTVVTAHEIIGIMEPLVRDAESAADSFKRQMQEKKYIIKNLNDALDSRIISINLLLSRAEVLLSSRRQAPSNEISHGISNGISSSENSYTAFNGKNSFTNTCHDVFDQQNEIIDLYSKGCTQQSIASKLSIPEGEVQLVISLKEKFIKMENQV